MVARAVEGVIRYLRLELGRMKQRMAFLLFSYPLKRGGRKREASKETYWHDVLLDRIVSYFGAKYPGFEISASRPATRLRLVQENVENISYFYLPDVPSKILSVMLFNMVSFFHLMTLRPSLVYSFTYGHTFPFLGALMYSKLARVPFFVDFRNPPASLITDPFPQPNYLERLFLRVADRIILRLSDRIVHINEKCKGLLKGFPKQYRKSLITGSFVEDVWFQDKAEVRCRLGKTKFACWGTLNETRKLEAVIRGFAKALSSYEDAQSSFYFIGSGPAATGLKSLAKELGVSEDVVFTGYLPQKELARFLKKIDVAVVPIPPHRFYQYSAPVKLVEAIAFELPILASDIEPNLIVEEYDIGFVCRHSANDYKEAFLRFMRCRDLRPFSRNCRKVKYSFHPENAFVELDHAVRRALRLEE